MPTCRTCGRTLGSPYRVYENDDQRTARLNNLAARESGHYCRPWNAGLASETSAVCRRLGRLFDALSDEINHNIVDGAIVEDIRDFRWRMLTKLEAEGWSLSYDGGNRLKVRPPGHKRPFKKQLA